MPLNKSYVPHEIHNQLKGIRKSGCFSSSCLIEARFLFPAEI